jgi:hypothetical protein
VAERKHLIRPDFTRLRSAIDNIERGGYRPSESELAIVDGIAAGVNVILDERLNPIERRLVKIEQTLIASARVPNGRRGQNWRSSTTAIV